ncbi:MAG: GNAT family N-acetyltransferase [Chloroflexi bacterium]|nr:GNAT family N-acetyltransferase [Chloroflexota bacterium]
MSEVIIRRMDIARDAEGLAAMWNASDLQWPGSWNCGVPTTAEAVREWECEERTQVVFIAEVDGEIAGYCNFVAGSGDSYDEGYLGLLNVSPKFQKRSIGRRLIQATIDFSVEKGWKRQTLDTWSANFKAVPTYKKTGHFWTPNSSVLMDNHIPGALQMPIAKPFFARHNWYDSYKRTLEQGADDERWQGIKVFTQHWEANGESLTIWIDREARAPVAVETDALLVAAMIADLEPVTGETVTLTWRVVNKTSQPLDVCLHAQGDKGLKIDYNDAYTIAPEQTLEHSAQVSIEADAPRAKDDGTAPAVRSLIRLGGEVVELFSGVRPKKALRLDTLPGSLSVTPHVAATVALQLHNARPEPVSVRLSMLPPEGLHTDWTQRQIEIAAKSQVSLPLSITADDERVYTLPVRGELPQTERAPLAEELTILSVAAGGVLAQRSNDAVRLETDAMRVTIKAKAGEISLEDKASGRSQGTLRPVLGLPYYPSDFRAREFSLELSQQNGHAVVEMAAESEYTPGLFFHQRIALASNGLLTVRCELANRSSAALARRVRLGYYPGYEDTTISLPLAAGFVRCPGGEYPVAWEDAPRELTAYREPWRCWERRGNVVALGWDQSAERIDGQWIVKLDSHELRIEPGERREALSAALYLAPGDWLQARRSLLSWRGLATDPIAPETRPVAQARLEPRVLTTVDAVVSARVRVDTVAQRPGNGTVELTGHDGLTIAPQSLPIHDLSRDNPQEQAVTLTLDDPRLGAFQGEAQLTTSLDNTRSAFSVLRLGRRGALPSGEDVRIYQGTSANQNVWILDNGLSRIVVAPDYGPSVKAWLLKGEEQLWSTFPTPQGFGSRYPTYGGLHPLLVAPGSEEWEGKLHLERFTTSVLDQTDPQGLRWLGVRLATQLSREQFKGLAVEIDWQTLSGSNVLRTVVRVCNLQGAEQRVIAGHELYGALGAAPTALTLLGEGISRQPNHSSSRNQRQAWGALVNQQTDRALLLISPDDDVVLEDVGQCGRLLRAERELRLAAHEVHEVVSYAVLTDSPAAAQGYRALRELAR